MITYHIKGNIWLSRDYQVKLICKYIKMYVRLLRNHRAYNVTIFFCKVNHPSIRH
ncbi:hypothetical protein K449DRAFT_23410 [Hypoxylon sp. EC38]|nr:hypothetical protein K449DRAFT_23410 [Hypoxylon sp. EC38]